MSLRRLGATAIVTALIAAALTALTPSFPVMAGALAGAQHTVDTQGPDVVITSAAGLLAWAVWAWGAFGLVLTAASALPGVVGGVARLVLRAALPAGARRSAAVLLGLGLGVAAPLAATALPALAPSASAAAPPAQDVPDWPPSSAPSVATPVPDWPTGRAPVARSAPPAERLVRRGDCLWHIAADSLVGELGRLPTDGEVARAVDAWWRANADVIGPDPDLLLPGQVLRTPEPP